ncbi:MAG: hypothetical protein AAF414_03265 [Pseudomonadota bacterium]
MSDTQERQIATEFDPGRDWVAVPRGWSYDTGTSLARARRHAATEVEAALMRAFPAIRVQMRAAIFVAYAMAALPAGRASLSAALAVCAKDAFVARSWPPPGRSKAIDSSVDDYLRACAERGLRDQSGINLVWSTVLATVQRDWLPSAPTKARIEKACDEQADTAAIDHLALDLRAPVSGGEAWAARRTRDSLRSIRSELEAGRPALTAVFRDPIETIEPEIVLVHRMAPRDQGIVEIAIYEPLLGPKPRTLLVRIAGRDVHIQDAPRRDGSSPVRALRHIDLAPAPVPNPSSRFFRLASVWRLRRWIARNRRPSAEDLAVSTDQSN